MKNITATILVAKRRRFLFSRRIYKCYAPVSEAQLYRLARRLNFKFTLGLSKWLLLAGYGDINKCLSFRQQWFSVIKGDLLNGYVAFAQDNLGNRFAFSPLDGSIYYISHPPETSARMADNFDAFLLELIRRDYRLADWIATILDAK